MDAKTAEAGATSEKSGGCFICETAMPLIERCLGSATIETRIRMGMICLDNISAVLLGRPAPSLVQS